MRCPHARHCLPTLPEIGRRMGISKNAVIGKAHRLELSGRETPIRRDGPMRPRTPRVQGPTLPAPAGLAPQAVVRPPMAPPERATPPLPPPAYGPAAPSRRTSCRHTAQPCCWPIGEPGRPGFRFCEGEAEPSRPYCPEHSSIAYAKPDVPREDAARQPSAATRRA